MTKTATRPNRPSAIPSGKRNAGAVPLSLRPAIERELDGWQELEGDADNHVLDGERPYSRSPTRGAARVLRSLARVGVPRPAMRRVEEVRPALVDLLKETSLDDLDGEALLEWITEKAELTFVDDFVSLAAEARSELTGLLAAAVGSAVAEGASLPTFAKKVVDALRKWAKRHALDARRLTSYEERLATEFGGVVWYREPEAQRGLVEQLARDAVALLKVRWARPAPALEAYSAAKSFELGTRIEHPKFGIGEVVRRLDGKVEVRFASGARTLAAKNHRLRKTGSASVDGARYRPSR